MFAVLWLAPCAGCELVIGGIPSSKAAAADDEQADVSPAQSDDFDVTSDAGEVDAGSFVEGDDASDDVADDESTDDLSDESADDLTDDDGTEPDPPAPTCDTIFYPDADKDGYGASAGAMKACAAPSGSYVLRGGDCLDSDARVHPGQTEYFGEGYTSGSGTKSYDFDCSGNEEGDPSLALGPSDCKQLSLPMCEGGAPGYMRTARAGAGLNAYCGSKTLIGCAATVAVVFCQESKDAADAPYGCR